MPSDKIIEHEEKKSSPLNYFKKVSSFQLGFILICFLIGIAYLYGFENLEDSTYLVVGAGVLILLIVILGKNAKGSKVDYETGQDLLEVYLNKRMRRVNSGLPEGDVIVTPKGYSQLYGEENYHVYYFYIRDYEEGFKHWFIGRISKQDGSFCGCQDAPGDISGEPPMDYGSHGGGVDDED